VHAQQGRLAARISDIDRPLTDSAEQEQVKLVDALSGKVAPSLALTELGGGRVTLGALLAPAKPLLLVFTDPRCSPCYELHPDIGGWQRAYGDRLSIALVSNSDPAANHAMTAGYGIVPVLMQQGREAVDAYNLAKAPAAVLISPDGRVVSGPRYGARAIRVLVAKTLGLAVPEQPAQEVQPIQVGQTVQHLRRPDLAGNVVELSGAKAEPTLLLFWSPDCHHCQDLLPDIRVFERSPGRPRLVVVSHGPIALNQEAGFTSPVILDDDRTIMKLFGAAGTPAIVLIDGRGVVATPVGTGIDVVRRVLGSPHLQTLLLAT
jgi:thiol-disulfide isomerase/thioredoxin